MRAFKSRQRRRYVVQLNDQTMTTFEVLDTIDDARAAAEAMSQQAPQWEVTIHDGHQGSERVETWQNQRCLRSRITPALGALHGVSIDQLVAEILDRRIHPDTPLRAIQHPLRDTANSPDLIEPGY
ncbi:MAG: hypothetical protein AAF531_23800 [Actinomycetota bacterium]